MKRDTKPVTETKPPAEPAAVPKPTDRVEVTLSLSKKTKEQLGALQQALDADSLSEVVRRAVQEFADNQHSSRTTRPPFGPRTPWGW